MISGLHKRHTITSTVDVTRGAGGHVGARPLDFTAKKLRRRVRGVLSENNGTSSQWAERVHVLV